MTSGGGNSGNNVGRFQYTGQVWLPEIGMYYYKARIYSQRLGRFLQSDPIGYDGGLNAYAYSSDDPINNIDPSGTVDLNLFNVSDPLYAAAQAFDPETKASRGDDSIYSIAGHGNAAYSTATVYDHRKIAQHGAVAPISPDELIGMMKGYKAGQTVLLTSCFGGAGYASTLAAKLHTTVIASREFVFWPTPPNSNGDVDISANWSKDGKGVRGTFDVYDKNGARQGSYTAIKYDAKTGMLTFSSKGVQTGTRIAQRMTACVNKNICK